MGKALDSKIPTLLDFIQGLEELPLTGWSQIMTPSPASPAGPSPNRRASAGNPPRPVTMTDAFADMLLPRTVTRKLAERVLTSPPAPSGKPKEEQEKQEKQKPIPKKAAAKQTPSPGAPLSPNDGNSIRDKIRKWQEEGGGIVEEVLATPSPGRNADEDATQADKEERPNSGRSNKRIKQDDLIVENPIKKESKAKSPRVDQRVSRIAKASSPAAPRRRVVSDEHWVKNKKKRDPPSAPREDSQENPSKGDAIENDAENTPIDEDAAPKKRLDGSRKISARKDVQPEEVGAESTEDLAENIAPKRPQRKQKRSVSPPQQYAGLDGWLRAQRTPTPVGDDEGKHERRRKTTPRASEIAPSEDVEETLRSKPKRHRERPRRKSEHVPIERDATDRAPRLSPRVPREKSPRQEPPERTADVEEPEHEPAVRPPANRVEAWLSGTPDPFVDDCSIADPFTGPASHPDEEEDEAKVDVTLNKRNVKFQEDDRPSKTRTGSKKRRRRPEKGDRERAGSPEAASRSSPDPVHEIPLSVEVGSTRREDPDASPTSPIKRGGRAKKRPFSRWFRSASPVQEVPVESLAEPPIIAASCAPASGPRLDAAPVTGVDVMSEWGSFVNPEHQAAAASPIENDMRPEFPGPAMAEDSPGMDGVPVNSQWTTQESSNANMATMDQPGQQDQMALGGVPLPADLPSLLSLPDTDGKRIKPARSIRTLRSNVGAATLADVMNEFVEDEKKYMRELHTLVDGVIPVLLSCVLSKSDSAIAASLYGTSTNHANDPNFTRPIIDMGVALERLKGLHKRIPLHDPDKLLQWARGAHKVYEDYIEAWRLGFEDVVVNLGPATPDEMGEDKMDEGMPRNAEGDVVDAQGNRVDIAYLQKRPLVRLKRLAKTLKVCCPAPLLENSLTF